MNQWKPGASATRVAISLEVDVIPDDAPAENVRIVGYTPPASGCSVTFSKGITVEAPGSAVGVLIVSDIKAAHDKLIRRDIAASDIWHGVLFPVEARLPGPDPKRTSYRSFFGFNDSDGNVWLVQEATLGTPDVSDT